MVDRSGNPMKGQCGKRKDAVPPLYLLNSQPFCKFLVFHAQISNSFFTPDLFKQVG